MIYFLLSFTELYLIRIIADSPERAYLRQQINHNGTYSCDICDLFADTKCYWPVKDKKTGQPRPLGQFRTKEKMLEIVDKYYENTGFHQEPQTYTKAMQKKT